MSMQKMTEEEFQAVMEERIKSIRVRLYQKGKEYGEDTNRLSNFYRAAQIRGNGTSAADVAIIWMLKHLISVFDIADDRLPLTRENMDEKMGDCISYLILLEAIMLDQYCWDNPEALRPGVKTESEKLAHIAMNSGDIEGWREYKDSPSGFDEIPHTQTLDIKCVANPKEKLEVIYNVRIKSISATSKGSEILFVCSSGLEIKVLSKKFRFWRLA